MFWVTEKMHQTGFYILIRNIIIYIWVPTFLSLYLLTDMRSTLDDELAVYYSKERLESTPGTMLVPVITVTGKKDTKNGEWTIVNETDRVRAWAFLQALSALQQECDCGSEKDSHLLAKMQKAASEVQVQILVVTTKEALLHEFRHTADVTHEEETFSMERNTNRYKFLCKLQAALQAERVQEMKQSGAKEIEKVLKKDVGEAFQAASIEMGFANSRVTQGMNGERAISAFLSAFDFLKKIHKLDDWRALEIRQPEGKTALFYINVASAFPTICGFQEDAAIYVLTVLKNAFSAEEYYGKALKKEKLKEANGSAHVETLQN